MKGSTWFGLVILAVSLASAFAHTTPHVQWQQSFGGSTSDFYPSIQQTADSGFILAGSSDSPPDGNKTTTNYGRTDIWLIRLDANGDKLWDKSYGGDQDDYAAKVIQTSDGGFVIAGYSQSDVSGNKTAPKNSQTDAWIVRVDANGDKLWDRTYGNTNISSLSSILQLPDGGFVVGGTMIPDGAQSLDYWIFRLDADGNKLWERSYGGTNEDVLAVLKVTADGGFILGGVSQSPASGEKTTPNYGGDDMWIVRLDANGNKLWEQDFGGDSFDYCDDVLETHKGRFIVAGSSSSGVNGNKTSKHTAAGLNACLVCLDSTGKKLWDRTYGSNWASNFNSVIETENGQIMAAGYLWTLNKDMPEGRFGQADYWILRTDLKGRPGWQTSFGGTGFDDAMTLLQTKQGDFVVCGDTRLEGGNKTAPYFGGVDFWAVRFGHQKESSR